MHVLVLRSDIQNSKYGPTKIAVRIAQFKGKTEGYSPWILVDLDPEQNTKLNTSSERPIKKLSNACFSFEIGHSKLKLWALKSCHLPRQQYTYTSY